MRTRIRTLATGALLLVAASGQSAAGDSEVTISSVWNEPVNTWLCAPAATCSTLPDDPDAVKAFIAANPELFSPSDDVIEIAEDSPAEAESEEPSEDSVASASATVSASISGNRVEESGASHRVRVEASFRGNTGIISANQAAGVLNAHANVQVIAIGPRGSSSLVSASSAGSSHMIGNTIVTKDGDRQTLIKDSFGGSAGIAAINQSAGHLNQQSNVTTLAVGLGDEALALAESELEALSSDNRAQVSGGHSRSDVITGSFGGYKGVAQVTQSSGDGNIVRNNLTISVQVAP